MVERFEVGNYYRMVSNSNNVGEETFNILKSSPHHYEATDFVLVQKGKKGKVIKESPIRYMVYGTGCENKGTLVLTEKELKSDLTEAVNNRSWTGRIIGYKLIPIYTAENKVKINSLIKKVKKKATKE